ncbi:Peptidase M28 domain-containing protein [Sphingomonas antarctica]|uniref:M20/M25/M40 family metallo-hydrolase n=1 Tax=Sphingomonas antarctica TaxID=2040274 RepID=UPI0039EB147E
MKRLVALALAALHFPLMAQTAPDAAAVAQLRDGALNDTVAWDLVEGLTSEIGARPAGSVAERHAREWGVAKLKALGFANVHIDEFKIDGWVRGEEAGEIVGPNPQRLALAALGRSGATPAGGITAEIVRFDSLAQLQAAPAGSLKGKIAFVTHRMAPTQDGSSYGAFGPIRFAGPGVAASKGAVAILIRSVGSDHHRMPHTGVTNFAKGVAPIPAAALSVPDAELIERLTTRGPVRIHLTLTPRNAGVLTSGQVVAEIPGSDPAAGVVVIGGHLDSWDLATGAIDDGAGVAITTAAAKHILDSGIKPRRTIRVVWFGSEEIGGGRDGDGYQQSHGADNNVFAAESDFGADRVWQFNTKLPPAAAGIKARLAEALAPLGIAAGPGEAHGGSDVEATIAKGAWVVDLRQDGTRYFDTHHSADDTLDRIDPVQLRQNVAAWTAMLAVVANAPEALAPAPKP